MLRPFFSAWLRLVGWLIASVIVIVATTSEAAELSRIRVTGTSAIAENVWPLFIAQERGFFTNEALEVQLTFTRESIKALIGGSVHIVNEGADDGLTVMQKGQNVIAVGAIQVKPGEFLVTLPDIKAIDQLRGKQFAVSAVPSTDMRLAADLLESRGLKRGDLVFRKIGFTGARLAALQSKQVAATLLSPAGWLEGNKKTQFNTLATPADFGIFPWVVMQTQGDWARKNKKLVVAYIRAVNRAIQWLYDLANLQEAKRIIAPKAQLDEKDVEDLLRVVQQDKIYFTGKLTPDIFKRAVDFLVEEGSLKAPVDLNQFLDASFWNEAFAR
jgi:ABC-type nitrate/sulfonate/bicarbonate transport system substrate-binding protein